MKYFILVTERRPITVIAKVRAADRRVAYSIAEHHIGEFVPMYPAYQAEVHPVFEATSQLTTQLVVEVDKRSFDALNVTELKPKYTGYFVVDEQTFEIVAYISTAKCYAEAEQMVEFARDDDKIYGGADYALEPFNLGKHNTVEGLVWICY